MRESLAWAAGFFEGEGCFTRSSNRGQRASLVNTDMEMLTRFQDVVGFGKIYPVRGPSLIPGRKTQYVWATGRFEHLQALTSMLWRWLSPRRKARAMEILRVGMSQPNVGTFAKYRPECGRGHNDWRISTRKLNGRNQIRRVCVTCERDRHKETYAERKLRRKGVA